MGKLNPWGHHTLISIKTFKKYVFLGFCFVFLEMEEKMKIKKGEYKERDYTKQLISLHTHIYSYIVIVYRRKKEKRWDRELGYLVRHSRPISSLTRSDECFYARWQQKQQQQQQLALYIIYTFNGNQTINQLLCKGEKYRNCAASCFFCCVYSPRYQR